MKKLLSIFAVALMFAACKSKMNKIPTNMVLVDTTGLYKSNALTDVGDNKYVINDKAGVDKSVANSPKKMNADKNSGGVNNSSGSSTNAPVATAEAPVKKDKGWSSAAKGTAIGAGSGAVLGAVVAKNDRGKGAVIGGVIGAGAGYIIGRSEDKKSGRVARAKARRAANQ